MIVVAISLLTGAFSFAVQQPLQALRLVKHQTIKTLGEPFRDREEMG